MVKVDKILSMGIKTGVSIVPYQLLLVLSLLVGSITMGYFLIIAKPVDSKFTVGCSGFDVTPEKQQECDDKEASELKEFEDNKKIAYIVGSISLLVIIFSFAMIMKKISLLADKLGE